MNKCDVRNVCNAKMVENSDTLHKIAYFVYIFVLRRNRYSQNHYIENDKYIFAS